MLLFKAAKFNKKCRKSALISFSAITKNKITQIVLITLSNFLNFQKKLIEIILFQIAQTCARVKKNMVYTWLITYITNLKFINSYSPINIRINLHPINPIIWILFIFTINTLNNLSIISSKMCNTLLRNIPQKYGKNS